MKKKRIYITIAIVVILLVIGGLFIYRVVSDQDKLTSEERTWINENINNVQNVYLVKDENIFSKDGTGVFNTFLQDFTNEYKININPINFEGEINNDTIKFNYTKTLNANEDAFYKDHYILVSKNFEFINNNEDLNNKIIGILNSDIEYVKSYLKDVNINYNGYENIDELFKALDSNINYILIPRMKYIDKILTNNLEIIYHFSDINVYYTFDNNNSIFSSILHKYYHKWQDALDEVIKKEEFKIFTNSLKISDPDIDKLLSVDYRYGFTNNSPYEVIMSGNYGGIVATYLQEFSTFSGVYFDITKYGNNKKLVNAINKDKVDLYFDFDNSISSNYKETSSGITSSLSIITNKKNNKVFNSIYSLQGEEVYVLKDSNLMKYLSDIGNIEIHTYDNNKELFKLNKDNKIIVMDTYIFNYYKNSKLNNYVSKYNTLIDNNYKFKINSKYDVLNTLLSKYISYLDPSVMIIDGINNHNETVTSGSILNTIAKYFILTIIGIFVIGFIVYKKSKKIRIARRLKKDEKIRFIDELTLLKNRAYLSDFMKTWSNNNIYPQGIIVVDLNHLQEINDKYGVSEGDKQIQSAANALIKTQLDNSELIRSDGNEFVIYTIGYNQKQIINYIHKLNKELKKLPYDYGAEFGFSLILNNLKTIEDALTEAIEDMKSKKDNESKEEKYE